MLLYLKYLKAVYVTSIFFRFLSSRVLHCAVASVVVFDCRKFVSCFVPVVFCLAVVKSTLQN